MSVLHPPYSLARQSSVLSSRCLPSCGSPSITDPSTRPSWCQLTTGAPPACQLPGPVCGVWIELLVLLLVQVLVANSTRASSASGTGQLVLRLSPGFPLLLESLLAPLWYRLPGRPSPPHLFIVIWSAGPTAQSQRRYISHIQPSVRAIASYHSQSRRLAALLLLLLLCTHTAIDHGRASSRCTVPFLIDSRPSPALVLATWPVLPSEAELLVARAEHHHASTGKTAAEAVCVTSIVAADQPSQPDPTQHRQRCCAEQSPTRRLQCLRKRCHGVPSCGKQPGHGSSGRFHQEAGSNRPGMCDAMCYVPYIDDQGTIPLGPPVSFQSLTITPRTSSTKPPSSFLSRE